MRVITVPVVDRPECVTALQTAFDLADTLNANVHGYHLIAHDPKKKVGADSLAFRFYSNDDPDKHLSDEEKKQHSLAANEFFLKLVEENGFTFIRKARYEHDGGLAMWHEMKGSPEKFFSIAGPMSDLIIVSRPETRSSLKAQAFMLSALMYSGRPVLVMPKKKPHSLGKRILIAWNQSIETIGAIAGSLPLLQSAEEINLITAGGEYRAGPKVQHLKQYLKHWDIELNHIKTHGDHVEDEIVNTYRETRSDLLLMGAYSRNHWREKLFGGVTNHMLYKTNIPVLMLHR